MSQSKRSSGNKQNGHNGNSSSNRDYHHNNQYRSSRGPYQRKHEPTAHAKQKQNALYLIKNPRNLYEWKDKFITYACAKYDDAGIVSLKTGGTPEYMAGNQFKEDNRNLVIF